MMSYMKSKVVVSLLCNLFKIFSKHSIKMGYILLFYYGVLVMIKESDLSILYQVHNI